MISEPLRPFIYHFMEFPLLFGSFMMMNFLNKPKKNGPTTTTHSE